MTAELLSRDITYRAAISLANEFAGMRAGYHILSATDRLINIPASTSSSRVVAGIASYRRIHQTG
jgi:hypothetical protein